MDAVRQTILVFLAAILLPPSLGVNTTTEVNSTGKGYVTIRRENTTTNISEDEVVDPASADASPLAAERYHMPAIFSSFNGGRPFYLEKDPVTGAIDFDAHAADRQDSDYIYDDELESDGIDRKDGSIRDSVRPAYPAVYNNEYNSNVHSNHKYYQSDKIPLISSSYANTKVQGTAGNHRTNKPTTTVSTHPPSYYPVRPHHMHPSSSSSTTTTTTTTSTSTTTTTTPRPTTSTAAHPDELYEDVGPGTHVSNPSLAYEYDYDLDNLEEEGSYFDGPKDTPPTGGQRPPIPISASTTSTTTTTTPSTTRTTTKVTTTRTTTPIPPSSSPKSIVKPATTTVKTIQVTPSFVEPDVIQPQAHVTRKANITSTTTTAAPPTTPTVVVPGIIYSEPSSNIVTSMPLGTHFHFRPPSTAGLPRQPEVTTRANDVPNLRDPLIARPSDVSSNVVLKPEVNPYGTLAEEPFRPIFGPGEGIEETLPPSRLPEHPIPLETPTRLNYPANEGTNNYFSLRPNLPPRVSGIEPPRLLPPQPFILQPTSERPIPAAAPTTTVMLVKDNTTQRPKLPPPQWVAAPPKVNTGGQIKFPDDNQPPQEENQNDLETPIEVEPTATFLVPNRPPTVPVRTPSTELRPPAEPDQLRPQTGWNINPRPPPQVYPQPPLPQQNALPKVDTVQPTYVQGSHNFNSNHKKPNHEMNRPFHGQNNRYGPKNPVHDVHLPNILPQFRPNAKVSHGHSDGLRHPNRPYHTIQHHHVLVDNLQPPPPPPPPTPTSGNLRINRNDAESEIPFGPFISHPAPPRPLVRRRTGPPVGEVATLQMMQQHQKQQQQAVVPGEKRPVFVVYPVNSGPPSAASAGGVETPDGGVVVGTRGPHLPLPPTNLDSSYGLDLDDDLDGELPFIHTKNQKPLLHPALDREDTPILKTHAINSNLGKRPIKTDFPYPIIRPEAILEDDGEKKLNNDSVKKITDKDTAHPFSSLTDESIEAEVHNSDVESDEEDTEINIIPYLQDYMPFATKKPQVVEARKPIVNAPSSQNNQWTSIQSDNYEGRIVAGASNVKPQYSSPPSPISATLTVVSSTAKPPTTSKPFEITDFPKQSSTSGKQHTVVQQGVVGSGGSEFTVSAIMHTHPQQQQQQQQPSQPSKVLSNHKLSNTDTSTVAVPAGLNFQAPFLASVNVGSGATPTNHGWSVVGPSADQHMRPGTVDRADLDRKDSSQENPKQPASSSNPDQSSQSETGNFDFENFKPQLFGGFKPIYSFPEEEKLMSGSKATRPQITTERQEKKLL